MYNKEFLKATMNHKNTCFTTNSKKNYVIIIDLMKVELNSDYFFD